MKKLVIGNDHAALEMRKELVAYLSAKGYEFVEIGTDQNGNPMIAKNGDQGISVTQAELSAPAGIRGYGYAQVQ